MGPEARSGGAFAPPVKPMMRMTILTSRVRQRLVAGKLNWILRGGLDRAAAGVCEHAALLPRRAVVGPGLGEVDLRERGGGARLRLEARKHLLRRLPQLLLELCEYVKATGKTIIMDEEKDKDLVVHLLDFKARLDSVLGEVRIGLGEGVAVRVRVACLFDPADVHPTGAPL